MNLRGSGCNCYLWLSSGSLRYATILPNVSISHLLLSFYDLQSFKGGYFHDLPTQNLVSWRNMNQSDPGSRIYSFLYMFVVLNK